MKAMILAAGLGTRLRPWTLEHPKALVPVGGVPMLERVIGNLRKHGFDYIVVNVHHFAGQVVDFLRSKDFGVEIKISDESEALLDTGGAILHAAPLLRLEEGPVLVHNVDILSNAPLGMLMSHHEESGADSTLLVSDRESSRRLIFDGDMRLRGWHHAAEGRYLPENLVMLPDYKEYAFSGIYVAGAGLVDEMRRTRVGKFPVIEFLLEASERRRVEGFVQENLNLIDIGKPATLSRAESLFR